MDLKLLKPTSRLWAAISVNQTVRASGGLSATIMGGITPTITVPEVTVMPPSTNLMVLASGVLIGATTLTGMNGVFTGRIGLIWVVLPAPQILLVPATPDIIEQKHLARAIILIIGVNNGHVWIPPGLWTAVMWGVSALYKTAAYLVLVMIGSIFAWIPVAVRTPLLSPETVFSARYGVTRVPPLANTE